MFIEYAPKLPSLSTLMLLNNNILKIIIFFLITLMLSCDFFNQENYTGYPTTIYPQNSENMLALELEFTTLNENRLCPTLNTFGLTGHKHCSKSNPGIKIHSAAEVIAMAKSTLLLNQKFTNVLDTSKLVIKNLLMLPSSDSTHWRIIFDNQVYSEYEVKSTSFYMWLHGSGVYRINGHWYKDIFIPRDRYSFNDAKKGIVGLDITYSDFSGNPIIITVSKDSFTGNAKKFIYPLETKDSIELHITWQIGIDMFESAIPHWYVYVDAITNKVIKIQHLFVM